MMSMDIFSALSTPIRRQIVELLAEGNKLAASVIAENFNVSPSAISQHLKVLLDSDIVEMHKVAQQRMYQLNPDALRELETWVEQMTKPFDALGSFITTEGKEKTT
jgi:DNA-binding transcriptional ArsR family regulator